MNWEIISALTLGLSSFNTSSITQNDVWDKKVKIVVKLTVLINSKFSLKRDTQKHNLV